MNQMKQDQVTGINSTSCLDVNTDQLGCQDEEGPNESTTESKKNTNASSSGISDVKSEHYNPTDKVENDINDAKIAKKEPLHFDYQINHLRNLNSNHLLDSKQVF